MAICKYCGKDKSLVDAHILPKAFYPQPTKVGPAVLLTTNEERPKRSPMGIYDKHVLCAECDRKLGVLDQHAIEHLLRAPGRLAFEGHLKFYDDASPRMLRLFIGSLAWRASISGQDAFDRVSLGPYEVLLHAMLYNDTIEPRVSAVITEFDMPEPPFIVNPMTSRIDGVNFLNIYGARFHFYLKLDKRPIQLPLANLELTEGNPVMSLVMPWVGSPEAANLRKMAFGNPHMERIMRDQWKWASLVKPKAT